MRSWNEIGLLTRNNMPYGLLLIKTKRKAININVKSERGRNSIIKKKQKLIHLSAFRF